MSLKAKIEAVLFLTSKPIKAQALARIVNADVQLVRQALLELVHDYEERHGGLMIADDDGYSFQVKEEYSSLMDEFLPVEMSAALIRTLSAIAIKQPVMQSEIIRVRGAGAYDHIRELVAKDLISKKEEQGERSPMLSTTKKFQEYFKLSKDGKDLRNYLKRQVKKADAAASDAEKQLVIPNVVSPEADDQLNSGIFLETADYNDEVAAAEVPVAEVAAPPVVETEAVTTLSKLADAANTNEPLPVIEADEIEDPNPPVPPTPSNVQAHAAKRKEPKMAKTPDNLPKPTKKAKPAGLSDLLAKQKQLELELQSVLSEDDEDADIITPSPSIDTPITD